MANPSIPKRAVELAQERWGRLDAVIVNHGTLDPVKKVADAGLDEWRKGFDINVFSAIGLVCWKIPPMFFSFLVFFFSSFQINVGVANVIMCVCV